MKEKKEKKKLTIKEKICYTIVTIFTFIIVYMGCEILINGQNWYKGNISEKELYSLTIDVLKGDELYDKMIYFEEVHYKPEIQNTLTYVNNRTPQNIFANLFLRYQQKFDKFIHSFSTNSNDYANQFRLTLMTKDEKEYDVVMTEKNQKEILKYIKNLVKENETGNYELE